MRGRKPKPTNVKRLEGNPGKRPLNENEPQPVTDRTTPPSHLSPEAKTEWRRIYPELHAMGLANKVDRAALAAYCQVYGRWAKYERIVSEKGELYKTAQGNIQTSPALWVVNKALEQMYKYLTEFGMTPASRSRIQTSEPVLNKDPMEELLDYCKQTTK